MGSSNIDLLLELNDSVMAPLIQQEPGGSEAELERLIVETADPVVSRILGRFARARGTIAAQDVDDIAATIHLRLIEKLREVAVAREHAIVDFEKYVAMLTYNAVNDYLRRRFPERARLKNRLRYVLMHDPRLGIWTAGDRTICGLSAWNGAARALPTVPLDPSQATGAMRDRERPGDALVAMFERLSEPVVFDGLVDFTTAVWQVTEQQQTEIALVPAPSAHTDVSSELETREMMRGLWAEVQELRPMQRKALLLNLRGDDTVNVISLLVITGIASFRDVAAALEMTPGELLEIWNDLPLNDLAIAARLQITRQQVINLRKTARERLRRRVS